jgi:hypothetical protein
VRDRVAASIDIHEARSADRPLLGAGASRSFGYALTAEVLPRILDQLRSRSWLDPLLRKEGRELDKFIRYIFPGIDDRAPPPITDLLSLIDHCIRANETLARSETQFDLGRIRKLLDRAIVECLIEPIHERAQDPTLLSRWVMKNFPDDTGKLAIVSTNYDASADMELLSTCLDDWATDYDAVDFGCTWRDPDDGEVVTLRKAPLLRLYKLHGSLNWLRCVGCGFIYVNFQASIANLTQETCECGYRPLSSVLVAPSLVRDVREQTLLSVWRAAQEAMRRARHWSSSDTRCPPRTSRSAR